MPQTRRILHDTLSNSLGLNIILLPKNDLKSFVQDMLNGVEHDLMALLIQNMLIMNRYLITRQEWTQILDYLSKYKPIQTQNKPSEQAATTPIKHRPFDTDCLPTDLVSKMYSYLDHKSHICVEKCNVRLCKIGRLPQSNLYFGSHFESTPFIIFHRSSEDKKQRFWRSYFKQKLNENNGFTKRQNRSDLNFVKFNRVQKLSLGWCCITMPILSSVYDHTPRALSSLLWKTKELILYGIPFDMHFASMLKNAKMKLKSLHLKNMMLDQLVPEMLVASSLHTFGCGLISYSGSTTPHFVAAIDQFLVPKNDQTPTSSIIFQI